MVKLDDYIEKNGLNQEEVYGTVLFFNKQALKNHIGGDGDIEIDAFAVDFLNKLYDIDTEAEKIKILQETSDLNELGKKILKETKQEIMVSSVEPEFDDISLDGLDMNCKIEMSQENEVVEKEENHQDLDIEKIVCKYESEIQEQNKIIEQQNKVISKYEKDIHLLKKVVLEQNELIVRIRERLQ